MHSLIKLSMSATCSKLNQKRRKGCFEIFGYDFLIDAHFKPWLIEVNTNPCLEESSPLLERLVPRMIDDAFRLTIDQYFPYADAMIINTSPYLVENSTPNQNLWYASPTLIGPVAHIHRLILI